MARNRIHLIGPAGSCGAFVRALGLAGADELITLVQRLVGEAYRVTGNAAIIETTEDEAHGGRADDAQRAADIQKALADDDVRAVVAIRGGAWLTRVMPHIDFSVLDRRNGPITVFGFSEISSLVNIVAGYTQGFGVYDMSPAFLTYGLRKRAAAAQNAEDPKAAMRSHLLGEFGDYFRDVVRMLHGSGSARTITAKLCSGAWPTNRVIEIVGGNLAIVSALVGTRYDACIRPDGRWLLIEDVNEKIERIDRMLAHFSLAGFWESCAGLLVGDFHLDDEHLTPSVCELLPYHLPSDRSIPVLTTRDIGHVWPMSPVPLARPLPLAIIDDDTCRIGFPVDQCV